MRRVSEISVVTGRCEDSVIEIESVFKWNGKEHIKGLGNLDTIKSKRNRIN
jgi:hypothetical protein